MIKKIKRLAKEKYDAEDFKYHILPVVKNALILAKRINADLQVVEAAAYLHDIGRAIKRKNFEKENQHHIIGAQESKKILRGFGCDDSFINKVEHCVLAHRGRKGPDPKTKEAKIIACADAMAHFDTFLDLFYFFLNTTESFEKAIIEVEQKIERNWNKKLTIPEAKELIKPKYEAIKLLINTMKDYIRS